MCDYSLEHVLSRDAVVSDRLITTRFRHAFTGGFAALESPDVAVCLKPGTEIVFDSPPRYHALFWPKTGVGRTARFRQVVSSGHKDALEFADGTIVLLTKVLEGQRAVVLQLPAVTAPVAMERKQTPLLEPVV